MNPTQQKILYMLRDIQLQQKPDSPYFDPKSGGTNSDNFFQIDSDFKAIEAEADGLERMGYLKILDRGSISKGLQLTDVGLNWINDNELIQNQIKQAQNLVDYELSEDQRVTEDFNRMRKLKLI